MKPARFPLKRLVLVLFALAGGVFVPWWRGEANLKAGPPLGPPPAPATKAAGSSGPEAGDARGSAERRLDLSPVESKEHQAQIRRVVDAMDATGSPPHGVAQGGRKGGRRGVFQNAEGRLPRKATGYWIESDVWPKHGPRDAERLIFGREGEVYWTRDHYETFVQLR